jgi:hypothetical protein
MPQKQRGQCVYVPAPEDIPVTFQIGMVGEDGVLLASDTCCTQGSSFVGSIRRTEPIRKIQIDRTNHFAYCWAGDDLGILTAQAITAKVSDLEYGEFKSFLYACASTAVANAKGITFVDRNRRLNSCTLLISAPTSSAEAMALWKLQIQNLPEQAPVIMVEPIDGIGGKTVTGDQSNPAVFFTERYFPRGRKSPMQDLILLAAHTVVMASKFNSGVSGLQIVLCRQSGFHELSEEEMAVYADRSKAIDSDISDWLGIPRP